MARLVKCAKLGRELEGLDKPPWPGDLGLRIYNGISQEAWNQWLEEAKILINETRLDPTTQAGQDIYASKMEEYFFGGGSDADPLKII